MKDKDIRAVVKNYICGMLDSPLNSLGEKNHTPIYENVLLGAASGADSLFESFSAPDACGAQHCTPLALFRRAMPKTSCRAQDLSVICWVLPQSAETRRENRAQSELPAPRWGLAKLRGEEFYIKMGRALEQRLNSGGIPAFFPMGHPEIVKRFSDDRLFLSSFWSERHACFAAGLGTFGLCDGLITPAGKAHRCGSIIVKARVTPTPRTYLGLHDYCPYFTNKSCGTCAKRCPVEAISESGHNKEKCHTFLHGEAAALFHANGFDVSACGLCQTGVPCEDRIPGGAFCSVVRDFI